MKEKDKGDGQSTVPLSSIALSVRSSTCCHDTLYANLRMLLPQACQTKKIAALFGCVTKTASR